MARAGACSCKTQVSQISQVFRLSLTKSLYIAVYLLPSSGTTSCYVSVKCEAFKSLDESTFFFLMIRKAKYKIRSLEI